MKAMLFSLFLFFSLISISYAKINLNTADVKALAHCTPGIGEKRAQAIVTYREAHGPYKSIEDLGNVPSFGKNFVKNRLEQFSEVFEIF